MRKLVCTESAFVQSIIGLIMLLTLPTNLASEPTDGNHSHHNYLTNNPDSYTNKFGNYIIPDITLIQSDGINTSLKEIVNGDEAILLNFIFTSCTAICPIMSATFSQVNRRLKSENHKFRMISISIDPEYDTPVKLKEYAKRFNAGANWVFLTGDLKDIVSIQKAFSAYRGNKMNHASTIFMRATGSSTWLRLDGFASVDDIVNEFGNLTKNNY